VVEYLLGLGVLVAVYAINAVSLNLQVGVTGLMNFGQVAFVGIGGYSVAICGRYGLGWITGFIVGAVLAGAFGAAVGRLGRTLASDYWAIATLALAELIRLVVLNQDRLTGGPQGIGDITGVWGNLSGPARAVATLATVGVLLVVAALIAQRLTGGQYGRVLRTIRENQDLAASLGHDVVSAKIRIMALSAALASISGSFYAMYISFIGPSQLLPFATFLVFTMVVVGGLGNNLGAVAGAALIAVLYDVTRFLPQFIPLSADQVASLRILVVGVVLLAFLLTRTRGLVPETMRTFDARR